VEHGSCKHETVEGCTPQVATYVGYTKSHMERWNQKRGDKTENRNGDNEVILRKTRILAINVAIPNLTVARLEQFRSPQLRIKRERPTDVGTDWKQAILYTKPHVIISRQSPFAANIVSKLVALATSLTPSISAMSSLDSLIPETYKPTPRSQNQPASR